MEFLSCFEDSVQNADYECNKCFLSARWALSNFEPVTYFSDQVCSNSGCQLFLYGCPHKVVTSFEAYSRQSSWNSAGKRRDVQMAG